MTTTTLTAAQIYNRKVRDVMPRMASDLLVAENIEDLNVIGDIVFSRGEYLGGMASVLIALVRLEMAAA